MADAGIDNTGFADPQTVFSGMRRLQHLDHK